MLRGVGRRRGFGGGARGKGKVGRLAAGGGKGEVGGGCYRLMAFIDNGEEDSKRGLWLLASEYEVGLIGMLGRGYLYEL